MAAPYHRDINRLIGDLTKLLEKYLDPLATLDSNDYLELARLLIKFYLVNKQDFHKTLEVLVKLAVNVVRDIYMDRAKRVAIKDKLRIVTRPRLELYKDWLSIGIKITGLEALAMSATDPILKMLTSAILKLTFVVAAEAQRYAGYRYISKVAVAVEELSRRFREELMREFFFRSSDVLLQALGKVKERIWYEEVSLNTPEVIALADKLRRLREDVLYSL